MNRVRDKENYVRNDGWISKKLCLDQPPSNSLCKSYNVIPASCVNIIITGIRYYIIVTRVVVSVFRPPEIVTKSLSVPVLSNVVPPETRTISSPDLYLHFGCHQRL